jgi:hypothetical protein
MLSVDRMLGRFELELYIFLVVIIIFFLIMKRIVSSVNISDGSVSVNWVEFLSGIILFIIFVSLFMLLLYA